MRYVREYMQTSSAFRNGDRTISRSKLPLKREVEQTKHTKQNLLKQGEVKKKAKLEIQEKSARLFYEFTKKRWDS